MADKELSGSAAIGLNKASELMYPIDTVEVQKIVREAAARKNSISVYAATAQTDIGLSLTKMNRILEIDSANLVAVVEPGLRLGDLAKALNKEGLRFMPAETPFYHEKSVGEFYYEGCSNISSLKYGAAKHFLMGTEIVLPDGQMMKTGGKTVKNVTGYDMTRFMNAPFARFGVAVKFILKLLPAAEARHPVAAGLDKTETVGDFIDALKQAKTVPSYFLWIDPQTQAFMNGKGNAAYQLIFLELDGISEEVSRQHETVKSLLTKYRSVSPDEYGINIFKNGKWKELFTPSCGYVLADELKIMRTEAFRFIDKFYKLAVERGIRAGMFGQLAEGKLNIYFEDLSPRNSDFIKYIISILPADGGYSAGRFNRMLGLSPAGPLVQIEQSLRRLFDPDDIFRG
jgi:glycolate oxidase